MNDMARLGDLSGIRGRLTPNAALAPFTWFRVGGPADFLFQPADEEDLALSRLGEKIPIKASSHEYVGGKSKIVFNVMRYPDEIEQRKLPARLDLDHQIDIAVEAIVPACP